MNNEIELSLRLRVPTNELVDKNVINFGNIKSIENVTIESVQISTSSDPIQLGGTGDVVVEQTSESTLLGRFIACLTEMGVNRFLNTEDPDVDILEMYIRNDEHEQKVDFIFPKTGDRLICSKIYQLIGRR